VLLISGTLELLERRNEIEIGKCDSVSAGDGKIVHLKYGLS